MHQHPRHRPRRSIRRPRTALTRADYGHAILLGAVVAVTTFALLVAVSMMLSG